MIMREYEQIIEAYNSGDIELAEQYAMYSFRRRMNCDENTYRIAGIFNYARNEKRIHNTNFFEYLPPEWKSNISTLRETFNLVENILNVISEKKKNSIDSTEEEGLYREFCLDTGFSQELTDIISKKYNRVCIISMSKYLEAIEKSLDSGSIVTYEISVDSQQGIQYAELLNAINSDNVIIAIESLSAKQQIKGFLIEHGYSNDKILDFLMGLYSKIEYRTVDRVLGNYTKDCQGMILGLSHISMGLIPEMLHKNIVNCTVHAQDLYYNLQTIRHCRKEYGIKLQKTDTVVIDMFDYTYFNFDTSQSIMAFSYYAEYGGGDYGQHNYYKKSNAANTYDSIQGYVENMRKGMLDGSIQNEVLWEKLMHNFISDNKSELIKNEMFLENNVESLLDFDDFEEAMLPKGLLGKRHEETIEENKKIFEELLEEIYDINPQMRVILIIVPQYSKIRNLNLEKMKPWKEEFYEIINKAKNSFPIEFYDLKNHKIGDDPANYYDLDHLNYSGAVKFTEVMNDILDGKI